MPKLVPLAGSERVTPPGARIIGRPDPNERIVVTVIARRRDEDGYKQFVQARQRTDRAGFAAAYGADAADVEAVAAYARSCGLEVVETRPAERRIILGGSIAHLTGAFGTSLALFEYSGGRYRGRVGPLFIPEHLQGIIQSVTGFDDRPAVRPRFRIAARSFNNRTFSPPQIASLYNFPKHADGTGQTIAILEFGGGYRDPDLDAYFTQLGIARPHVTSVAIDGADNQATGDPQSADGEVVLDVEVCGAIAPGARQIVYFAPNTDQGFIDAVASAVHDRVNSPSIISISWGAPEDQWVASTRQAIDQFFQDAAVLGVSVFAASGDSGSSDGVDDGLLHADYPASSPWVTGCGGTTLMSADGNIADEQTWNRGGGSTGGGVSRLYPVPDYQALAGIPPAADDGHLGRGVPDVAGNADPAAGYRILVDGQQMVFGGTSVIAPLWAGLIALINQTAGQTVGFLNEKIYTIPAAAAAFHDIVAGDNDASGQKGPYQARPGWDACTGLGSPNGVKLAAALAPAGSQPPTQPGGPGATILAFRTEADGAMLAPGTSRDLGPIDVHTFERIRVVASQRASSGTDVIIRLTTREAELSALLDLMLIASGSQVTRAYDVPGTKLAISVEAAGSSPVKVDVWVYGWTG